MVDQAGGASLGRWAKGDIIALPNYFSNAPNILAAVIVFMKYRKKRRGRKYVGKFLIY